MSLYINDVVEDCHTKKGHLIRMIVVCALSLIAIIIGMTIISDKKENQVIITENTATMGQIQSEIDYVNLQKQQMLAEQDALLNGEDSMSGSYFYPKKYADQVSTIQDGFCTGDEASYIGDDEIQARILKQIDKLNGSGLIDSSQMEFLYPWYKANRLPYTWHCVTKIASIAEKTPVVWECIDNNGYVYAVVIGQFSGSNTNFTDFQGFVTYYGQEVMNTGNTISSVEITPTDIMGVNYGTEYYAIDMQPVANAIHDGAQFGSVDEIRALAETKKIQ